MHMTVTELDVRALDVWRDALLPSNACWPACAKKQRQGWHSTRFCWTWTWVLTCFVGIQLVIDITFRVPLTSADKAQPGAADTDGESYSKLEGTQRRLTQSWQEDAANWWTWTSSLTDAGVKRVSSSCDSSPCPKSGKSQRTWQDAILWRDNADEHECCSRCAQPVSVHQEVLINSWLIHFSHWKKKLQSRIHVSIDYLSKYFMTRSIKFFTRWHYSDLVHMISYYFSSFFHGVKEKKIMKKSDRWEISIRDLTK